MAPRVKEKGARVRVLLSSGFGVCRSQSQRGRCVGYMRPYRRRRLHGHLVSRATYVVKHVAHSGSLNRISRPSWPCVVWAAWFAINRGLETGRAHGRGHIPASMAPFSQPNNREYASMSVSSRRIFDLAAEDEQRDALI